MRALEQYRELQADHPFMRSVQETCLAALKLGTHLEPQCIALLRRILRIAERTQEPAVVASASSVRRGPAAVLPIVQDGPGEESAGGPRHDNDHADFRKIAVMPTADEVNPPPLCLLILIWAAVAVGARIVCPTELAGQCGDCRKISRYSVPPVSRRLRETFANWAVPVQAGWWDRGPRRKRRLFISDGARGRLSCFVFLPPFPFDPLAA
jgi:hypothetical protein